MTESNIEFSAQGKKVEFTIIHNLPNKKGLSIEDCLNNWVHRTDEYTAKSLCEYINKKNTGYYCAPKY